MRSLMIVWFFIVRTSLLCIFFLFFGSNALFGLFVSVLDSGHGGQVEDEDGDEDDGFDESTSPSILFSTLQVR